MPWGSRIGGSMPLGSWSGPTGQPAFGDFGGAEVAADDADTVADRAQALVATALAVGPERAASAALAALGSDALQQVLPLLQPAVAERRTRHAVAAQDWDFEDLREACAARSGVELPKLAQLRRVSLRSLGVAALVALVVYALISALAQVGLDNLIDEFRAADLGWLAVALALSPVVPVAQAVATLGASFRPLRFGPVLMLEYAIGFIALAVPSSAARLALDIRFFGRNGIEGGAAISIGVIASVCGFVVQVLLILVISLSGLASLDLGGSAATSTASPSDSSSSDGYPLLVLTAVLVVAGVIVTVAVPKYRSGGHRCPPQVPCDAPLAGLVGPTALRVLRSPARVGMIFAGNLGAQVLQAIILGLCLRAFGHHATMAQLLLVNTVASLFAGFMPVPGGMGVAEAAYTAGLVALGVPNAAAMSTAIAFRVVTYLPPTDLGRDRHALAAAALVHLSERHMVAWTGWVPPVTVRSPSRRGPRQAAQTVRGWKSAPQVCWKTIGSAPGLQWWSPHSLRASRMGWSSLPASVSRYS